MGAANSLDISSAGLVKFDGTATFSAVTTTQHDLLIGAASNGITSVAPSATSGVPVISQGAGVDPTFGTAVVAGGGTGETSFTAYSVLCGGTTSTGALQNVSGVGTLGQVLTSNGASALPSWTVGGGGTGIVVAEKRVSTSTPTSSNTTLAITGTTPTTGNTVSFLSTTYTPTSSTNVLKFQFSCPYSTTSSSITAVGFFLFAGSTLLASYPCTGTSTATVLTHTASFTFYAVSGTTSLTTYAVYYATTGGTAHLLETAAAAAFYNSTCTATLIITEVTP